MKKILIIAAVLLAGLVLSCASGGGGDGGGAAAFTTEIVLAAKDAKTTGAAKYEVGDDRDNIGWWTETSATITWDFEVKEAGEYTVVVSYGVDDSHAGTVAVLKVGDATLEYTARSSGGWGTWREMTIGKANLKAGANQVVVQAKLIPSTYAANLHAVILKK